MNTTAGVITYFHFFVLILIEKKQPLTTTSKLTCPFRYVTVFMKNFKKSMQNVSIMKNLALNY